MSAAPPEGEARVSPCHAVLCFAWDVDFEEVMRTADAAGWQDAGIIGGDYAGGRRIAKDVRKCQISTGVPEDLRKELEAAVTGIGHYSYGFEVNGLRAFDPITVMRYAPGDHFGWHVDNGVTTQPMGSRKLSFTLQLSPPDSYDGGDLELATYAHQFNDEVPGPSPVLRERGNLIVFPSFMLHRVSPVTRGVRYAVVGWIHGPDFR